MDVANLNISIKTSGVSGAKNDLNNLDNAAKRAKNSAEQFRGTILAVKAAVAALAGSALIKEFVQTADAMSNMNSRLKMATSSMSEFLLQQKAMHALARETHSDIEDTTNLYVKLAPALKDLGKSTSEINDMVSSFTKALKLGGASAEESAAAIKQFGQAMGSGALRGDEFNSIAEASPTLLRYMAEGLGVNVGELRKLGSEGKLTAEALSDAFSKMKETIDEDFSQLPVTVGSAFADLKTEISLLTDDFNKVSDATGGLSGAIEYFANLIKDNRSDIIEFGRDVYRSFELMGTGILYLGAGVVKAFTAMPAAVLSAVDKMVDVIEQRINAAIGMAEMAYNTIAQLWGGETSFKRVDISTHLADGLLNFRSKLEDEIKNIKKSASGILDDIIEDTTKKEAGMREARALAQSAFDIMRGRQDQKAVPRAQESNKKGVAKAARDTSEQDAKKAERERIRQINEELKLKDRMFDLQKRAADLSYSEVEKNQKLVTIEYERAQASYKALLDKKEISKQFYDEAMALEEKLYQKQMFDASEWGRAMESGLSGIENAMSSFLDYSSDGFLKFGDLAKSVLGEIYKALVRELIISQMIAAIRRGVMGLFGGVGGAANAGAGAGMAGAIGNAQGGVYASAGLHAYANSIVSKPTFFAFANGGVPRLGVMGERNGGSPEAIMPLTRTSNGDLGVKAQLSNIKIEVINQTKEDAQVTNTQVRQDPEGYVVSLVMSGYAKNKNGIRDMLRK
nr:MAG TPA: Tail tape measure [Caudoviricetes sp.]DAW43175.1 MAG TPA: Tail tape measure [Caudoviricetes sp.]